MKRQKKHYNLINLIVILGVLVCFVYEYKDVGEIFQNETFIKILIVVLTVIIVHVVKSGRLYLALYGSEISVLDYLKIYCKVTPVGLVFPYKLGEFFRMYCYGKQLKNILKGIIIVLLDRFMDTMALVTMIFLIHFVEKGSIPLFTYVLLLFLIFSILAYYVFPGVYDFWKKFFLKSKATERRLAILRILDTLNRIYQEIRGVSKGRGMILYIMSLVAWMAEIGSIAVLNRLSGEVDLNKKISGYLTSALSGAKTSELMRFIFVSVILMISTYVVIKIVEVATRKR